MEYVPRIVDDEIQRQLAVIGAVVIEGARACGKTATARRHARSEVLLDVDPQAQAAAFVDPALLLGGDAPRLLDEWQTVPAIWNHVRREVDRRGMPGQFLLTGAATPADDDARHTGAGRFGQVQMRPMTLTELGRTTGSISLAALFDGAGSRSGDPGLSLDDLVDEVVRGGWPGLRRLRPSEASRALRTYLDRVARTDFRTIDGVRRSPERVRAVLSSLARHTATQAALTTIARDVADGGTPITDDTVASYIDVLRRLMIVEDQPAWNTHIRSSHQLRTTPTRHLVDPSLAVAALGTTVDALGRDLNAFGLLFESLVVRDLRVYAQSLSGRICHYRDNSGLEIDAIVDLGGRWAAFEVKLGVAQIDAAAASLTRFAARVDSSRSGSATVLGVIVGGGYGYVRPDGVHVIPIGSLTI